MSALLGARRGRQAALMGLPNVVGPFTTDRPWDAWTAYSWAYERTCTMIRARELERERRRTRSQKSTCT